MSGKKSWLLFLLLLSGVVIGSFLGYVTRDISWLSWLDYGKSFSLGNATGTLVDIGILTLTLCITIKISIASILGVVIAFLIYRKL